MENKTVEMVVKDLLLADNRKKTCKLIVCIQFEYLLEESSTLSSYV